MRPALPCAETDTPLSFPLCARTTFPVGSFIRWVSFILSTLVPLIKKCRRDCTRVVCAFLTLFLSLPKDQVEGFLVHDPYRR